MDWSSPLIALSKYWLDLQLADRLVLYEIAKECAMVAHQGASSQGNNRDAEGIETDAQPPKRPPAFKDALQQLRRPLSAPSPERPAGGPATDAEPAAHAAGQQERVPAASPSDRSPDTEAEYVTEPVVARGSLLKVPEAVVAAPSAPSPEGPAGGRAADAGPDAPSTAQQDGAPATLPSAVSSEAAAQHAAFRSSEKVQEAATAASSAVASDASALDEAQVHASTAAKANDGLAIAPGKEKASAAMEGAILFQGLKHYSH